MGSAALGGDGVGEVSTSSGMVGGDEGRGVVILLQVVEWVLSWVGLVEPWSWACTLHWILFGAVLF
ncbi:hypothetical protein RchiOBHm_Chr3g0471951 [Rosa chinensis]|uniref:Uncharacterized protein n=1 Tax=Rosa chinensis TaxID=74649 RepID=A0A2P6RBH0_ROSCH|nr:hypothetical protein RchiOBHm_Chr3g0471951 [Rosa chinensis]